MAVVDFRTQNFGLAPPGWIDLPIPLCVPEMSIKVDPIVKTIFGFQ